jgi:hypothetical protein
VPWFGNLLTVDRREIESCSIRALVSEYWAVDRSAPVHRGKWGAGIQRSSGIIERQSQATGSNQGAGFNLSQLNDPADLVQSLHRRETGAAKMIHGTWG